MSDDRSLKFLTWCVGVGMIVMIVFIGVVTVQTLRADPDTLFQNCRCVR